MEKLLSDIECFEPINDSWLGLDGLLDELWSNHKPSIEWVKVLMKLLDRFPNEDGSGVFWSIVHGVETIDGYEKIVTESSRNNPHEFKTILLKRAKLI